LAGGGGVRVMDSGVVVGVVGVLVVTTGGGVVGVDGVDSAVAVGSNAASDARRTSRRMLVMIFPMMMVQTKQNKTKQLESYGSFFRIKNLASLRSSF
jgi:hypothetical protein